ncbi:MAG: regulator of sirC expression with transglutaminase-like and TPR domain [Spirosomataceae bacterium]|jgi:regulator of sirC expression with transglutaminase-like and TPR domain
MDDKKIKALVTLLDDSDDEVVTIVEKEIKNIGGEVIPILENHWKENAVNPFLQKKLESIIHELQNSAAIERLTNWKLGNKSDLLEGLWAVASYQFPELDIEVLRQEIQGIYMEAWLQMRDELHPNDQIRILNQVFFDKFNFKPNTRNYYSPANSMINQVLETKRGNPISMCSIYLIVAQKLNLPVYGVNLPNLFVLTYKFKKDQFYINVFNRGVVFSKKDIEGHIKQMNVPPNDIFFSPCSNEEIIKRTLRNLIYAYKKAAEADKYEDIRKLLSVFEEGG